MTLNTALARFYALPVTDAIAAAITSDFARTDIDDLVDAHLINNPLYFGGIDKTLSGFVVLDDEGDNYTLLDLRGDGGVWWQDHETRMLEPRFANLADYTAFRERRDTGGEEERDLLQEYSWEPAQASATGSPALLKRYQWLMQLLAQPTRGHDGHALQSAEELVDQAFNRFFHTFESPEAEAAQFQQERSQLADDAHLALYWLLHAAMLGQTGRVAEIRRAISAQQAPLLQAFVATFGDMAPDADVAVVPDFRQRRAQSLFSVWADLKLPVTALLQPLLASPATLGPIIVVKLDAAMADDPAALDTEATLQLLERHGEADGAAIWALRARLLLQRGDDAAAIAAADTALRCLATTPLKPLGMIQLLHPIIDLLTDAAALQRVLAVLLDWDDLMTRVLDLAARLQALGGTLTLASGRTLEEQSHLANDLMGIWDAPSFDDGVAAAAPATRDAMATRLCRRPDLADDDSNRQWAVRHVLASTLPERSILIQRCLPLLSSPVQRQLLPDLCAQVSGPDDALIPLLLDLLRFQPPAGDISAEMNADARVDAILEGLTQWWSDARLFEPLMAALEAAPLRSVLTDRLDSGFKHVGPQLDGAQQRRLFAWALARVRADNGDHWAKHILGKLQSPDLADVIRATLEEESAALARNPEHHDSILSAMYSTISELAETDPAQLDYLVDQLWDASACFGEIVYALHKRWTPTLHATVMERLRQTPSTTAAAAYSTTLYTWQRRRSALHDLAQLVLTWPAPVSDPERGQRKCLLLRASAAVLPLHLPAQAKAFHAVAIAIEGDALAVDQRPGRSADPFADDADLQALLQAALDGSAEAALAQLEARVAKARASATPLADLSLAELGQRARVDTVSLWLQHPLTGAALFQDSQEQLHYFDGFDVATPPFEQLSLPYGVFDADIRAQIDAVSQRVLLWKGDTLYSWTRYGALVVGMHGLNNGQRFTYLGLRFGSDAEAEALVTAIASHPPKGFTLGDPWYLAGKGEIARELYDPDTGRRYVLGLRDGRWWHAADDVVFSGQDALTAMDALEAEVLRNGGRVANVEYLEDYRRPQDQALLEWLDELRQPADDTPEALLQAPLRTLGDYLSAHALQAGDGLLDVRVDAPALQHAIDALTAACRHPLPQALGELWAQHASIGWQADGQGRRLLAPSEVLAGAITTTGVPRWPLVVDAQGNTLLVLRDTDEEMRDVVAAGYDDADDELGSLDDRPAYITIHTAIVTALIDLLARAIPDAALLWHGQRGDADVQHLHLGRGDTLTSLRLDRDALVLAIHKGKRTATGKVRFQRLGTLRKAEAAWQKALKAAEADGQVALEQP